MSFVKYDSYIIGGFPDRNNSLNRNMMLTNKNCLIVKTGVIAINADGLIDEHFKTPPESTFWKVRRKKNTFKSQHIFLQESTILYPHTTTYLSPYFDLRILS